MPNVVLDGINIGYQVSGEGEALILLMGLGGDRNSWYFQTRRFKKQYKVIACDNRGVGTSDTPESAYTIKIMSEDIIRLMDHLEIKKAHILGVSMGGMIAQKIAISYPERVDKLILASTYLGGEEMGEVTIDMLKALGLGKDFSTSDTKSVDIEKFMYQIAALSFNNEKIRSIFMPLSKRYIQRVGLKGFTGQLEAAANSDTVDKLHLIKSETLIMTGTEDRVVPSFSSEIIAQKIPNAKLVKIDGGSHAMYIEMSNKFNAVVLNFLQD